MISQSATAAYLKAAGDIEQHAGYQQFPRVFIQVLLNEAIGAGRGVPQGLPGLRALLQKCPSLSRRLFCKAPLLLFHLMPWSMHRLWSLRACVNIYMSLSSSGVMSHVTAILGGMHCLWTLACTPTGHCRLCSFDGQCPKNALQTSAMYGCSARFVTDAVTLLVPSRQRCKAVLDLELNAWGVFLCRASYAYLRASDQDFSLTSVMVGRMGA